MLLWNDVFCGKYLPRCHRLKKKLICLELMVIAIVVFLVFHFYPELMPAPTYDKEYMLKNIEDAIQEALKTDRGTGCTPPKLDPFSPDMMKHVTELKPIDCKKKDWVRCMYDKCQVTNETHASYENIVCSYSDVITKSDDDIKIDSSVKVVKYDSDSYTLVRSDHAYVRCTGTSKSTRKKEKYDGPVVGVRRKVEGLKENTKKSTYNVLIFGFDSISHNYVQRRLPNAYKAVKEEFGGVVLQLYNIVGDGTPQALIPIFTGQNEVELPEVRKSKQSRSEQHTVDEFPFLWKLLKKEGYRTAYLEDMPYIGTFQYRMVGFKQQPTDHYLRGFTSQGQESSVVGCVHGRLTYEIQLDTTFQVMTVDNNRKFAFTFMADLSHNDINQVGLADEKVVEFLRDLKAKGVLDETLVIFMADHGHRYGVLRNHIQGRLEERLPLMSFIFPESFKANRPEAFENIKRNAHVLTTPYDIHATLLDFLGMDEHQVQYRVPGSALPRSMSLLQPIPESRSCSEAGVEPHWCSCLQWIKVQPSDVLYRKSAEAFVDFINELTQDYRSRCALRTLTSIEEVSRQKPNDKLLSFLQSFDADGYVGKFGTPLKVTENYQIKVTVGPGEGVYEASLKVNEKGQFSITTKDISRINEYGHEPDCISAFRPDLNMYCYCTTV